METLLERPKENVEEKSPRFERQERAGGAPVEEDGGRREPVDLSDNPLVRGLQETMDRNAGGGGGGKKKKGGGEPGSGVYAPGKSPADQKKAAERARRRQVQRDEDMYDAHWKDRDGMREVYRLDPDQIKGSATIVGAIPHAEHATDGNSLGHAFTSVKGQTLKTAAMPFYSLQDQQAHEEERWQEAFRQDGNRAGNITSFRPSGGEKTPATQITAKVALVVGNSNYAAGSGYGDLPGAKRDAANMASYYEGQGYQVLRMDNLSGNELRTALLTCRNMMEPSGMFAFYYAGHGAKGGLNGVQANASNDWMPKTQDLLENSVIWGMVSRALSGGWHATIITDSCHSGTLHDQHTLVKDNYDVIDKAMVGHEVGPVY